jgi:hypothetical protein
MSRPQPLRKAIKVPLILILLLVPFVVVYDDYIKDLNSLPQDIDEDIQISSSQVEVMYNLTLAYTAHIEVVFERLDTSDLSEFNINILSREEYENIDTGFSPLGRTFSPLDEQTSFNRTTLIDGYFYVIIEYTDTDVGAENLNIHISTLYDTYFARRGLLVVVFFGMYVLLAYYIPEIIHNYRLKKWQRELHMRRLREEENFMDDLINK